MRTTILLTPRPSVWCRDSAEATVGAFRHYFPVGQAPGEDGSGCAVADRSAPNYGYETVQALPDITFSACDDYTMLFADPSDPGARTRRTDALSRCCSSHV